MDYIEEYRVERVRRGWSKNASIGYIDSIDELLSN